MCGVKDKECATCYCGDGCLASMREDFWMKATKQQLIDRLDNGKYKNYTDLMKIKLKEWYDYVYESVPNT